MSLRILKVMQYLPVNLHRIVYYDARPCVLLGTRCNLLVQLDLGQYLFPQEVVLLNVRKNWLFEAAPARQFVLLAQDICVEKSTLEILIFKAVLLNLLLYRLENLKIVYHVDHKWRLDGLYATRCC